MELPTISSIFGLDQGMTAIVIAVISFAALELVLRVLHFVLGKLSSKTETALDDNILAAVFKRTNAISIVTSIAFAAALVYPSFMFLDKPIGELYFIDMLIVVAFMTSDIVEAFLLFYTEEVKFGDTRIKREVLPFTKNVVKFAILLVFAIIVVSRLGIDITPLVTGLGLGGLAVALALQDPLTNFFSGVNILSDKMIRIGDYIKIGDMEGTVIDIGWRTTKLRSPRNDIIIIPNKKMTELEIIDYKPPVAYGFTIGVAYGSDLSKVKKICTRILDEMVEEGLILKEPRYWFRVSKLGDFSIDWAVGFYLDDFKKRFKMQEEFLTRAYNSFAEEGVQIPFPTRTLYIKEEKKGKR